jgi:hypothetical protein
MLSEVMQLVAPLREGSECAYLYGSQVDRPNPANDIDLLFICENDHKNLLVKQIQDIQAGSRYLLHPVFVSREAFERNPYFAVLIRKSVRLW